LWLRLAIWIVFIIGAVVGAIFIKWNHDVARLLEIWGVIVAVGVIATGVLYRRPDSN